MKKNIKRSALFCVSLLLSISFMSCHQINDNPQQMGQETQSKNSESITTVNQESTQEKITEITQELNQFEQTGSLNNDKCSLSIIGIEPENLLGYTIKVNLENKSQDTSYQFTIESAAINGIQCNPGFIQEVSAGQNIDVDISFPTIVLEENGIHDFTDFQMIFRVIDSQNAKEQIIAREMFHVYPKGKNNKTKYIRQPNSQDKVIIDNDMVQLIVLGYRMDDLWGYTVDMFLVNKSGQDATFSIHDAVVNGAVIDPGYAISMPADTCAFTSVSWPEEILLQNNITDVKNIELLFSGYDSNDIKEGNFIDQKITLTP